MVLERDGHGRQLTRIRSRVAFTVQEFKRDVIFRQLVSQGT